MTVVPLPDVPCVRCRIFGVDATGNDWGSRFYLSYSGSAPSGADCTTLAGDVFGAFATHCQGLISTATEAQECDVLDIASHAGFSGQNTGAFFGTRSGTALPAQVATNVEYGIARRYRGGKPRAYWPFGVDGDMLDVAHWASAFVDNVNLAVAAMFTEIQALSVGSMGTLKHVNLSYYSGFTNHTNTSGRERAVPTYRPVALHDDITGYFTKPLLSSQRRRRVATTP